MRTAFSFRLSMTLMLLLLLGACDTETTAVQVTPDLAADFQSRYIAPYVAGNVDQWMQVFADDAVALHDGLPPLEGKDAIRGFGSFVTANFRIEQLDATIDEVRFEGDWAFTRGQFVANFVAKTDEAPPGVAGERLGKFLLIWERQADDHWQVIMDMGNSINPPPSSE